jgi:iron(III) transport system permease protein
MAMASDKSSAEIERASFSERYISSGPGSYWMWGMIVLTAFIVFPPIGYLFDTAFTITKTGVADTRGVANFLTVLDLSGWDLWYTTLAYAAGSSVIAIILGVISAWFYARTNAYFRGAALIGAFLSLAAPVIIKGIGWILLLGPNKGVINEFLRWAFGIEGVPIDLFSLGGMILIEGVLWTPIVFLLCLPPLTSMDPALEEAAATSGARFGQTIWKVTLPLALPSILAVLLLTFIRSLESFEVPLLIGSPGGLQTFTTAIYDTIHRGYLPRYGEASAYAALLIAVVALPLFLYYRMTREASKYATVTGKGYRPNRRDLGSWRLPAGLIMLIMPIALLAPLTILLWASFLPIYEPPSMSDFAKMSFDNYIEVVTRPLTVDGMWNGIVVATLSSTVLAGYTFVLAWFVVRRREASRWSLDMMASLPLVLPGIVLGIAILIEFLHVRFIPIYGTVWILVFAFLIKYMPYGMRFCYAGMLSVHKELEECARTSGARTITVLWRIVLPLTLPAVAAIWIYVFLHTVRDLGTAVMLAGPQNQIIAIVILELWENGEVTELGALSILLAIVVTILGWFFMKLTQRFSQKSL